MDLKKLSDVFANEFVKNKNSTHKDKLNRLEKRILDATTIININQYDPVKENLDGCIGDVDKAKYQIRVVYSLQLF